MAQYATLQELIVNLRFRLGDPRQGTFGLTRYDRFTENIDEMKLLCNEAQRAITVLCDTPTTALIRSIKRRLQIISEAVEYPLEDDYLGMDYVRHVKRDSWKPMTKLDFNEFPAGNRSEVDSDGFYRHWDVYGAGALEKAVGVIRQDSLNELHDRYANFDDIRVGDVVHNVSDGSQAQVVSIVPATQVLNEQNEIDYTDAHVTIDSLAGGNANRFQQGDQYLIASAEEIVKTLHVSPKIVFDDVNSKVYSGDAYNWGVQESFVLQAVDVYLSGVPEYIEPDDRMVIEVLKTGSTTELASKAPASFTSKVGAVAGLNRFVFDERIFPEGILIAEDTQYAIRATVGNTELPIQSINVYSYGTSDYIELSHTRLPAKMETDHAICEIPPFALDLFYAQAVELADMKIRRAKSPDPALKNATLFEKEKIDNFLWSRDTRGSSHLHDEYQDKGVNAADENFVAYVIGA